MRLVRNSNRFQLDCLKSLSGGYAPNWWRGDLAAETQRLNAVLQACGWLVEFDEVDLSVSRDPLFGHSLEVLTNREPNNPIASETARTVAHRPANGFEKSASKVRMTPSRIAPDSVDSSPKDPAKNRAGTVSKKPSSNYLPELITGLRPRAGIWILRQHAGAEEASLATSTQRPNVRRAMETSSDHIRVSADLPRETTPARLLARAARSAATSFFTHGRLRCGFDRLPSDDQAQVSTCGFAEYWSQPIDGVRASVALLTLLASPRATVTPNSQSGQKKEAPGPAPVPPSNDRSQSLPSIEAPGKSILAHEHEKIAERLNRKTKRWSAPAEVESSKDRLIDTSLLPPEPSRLHPVGPDAQFTVEAGSAAPTLTSSLVALRSRAASHEVDLHLPAVATINQREAKAETATSEADDLALLAAKVEKLLNQEARRHGIDV